MSYPVVEVASIILKEGKVLIGRPESVGKQQVGLWELPSSAIRVFEELKNAAIRGVFSLSGVTSDPQTVLFVSEVFDKSCQTTGHVPHRVIIYVYSMYTEGELKPNEGWEEAQWYDIRQLGEIQDDMSSETADAFFKFSQVLRQKASGAQS